jgi:adenosylcobinamide-GDP ribazoletransferase
MFWAEFRLAVTLLTVIPLPARRAGRPAPVPGPAAVPVGAGVAAVSDGPAIPVPAPGLEAAGAPPADLRRAAGPAMEWAPAIGLLLGLAAAGVLWLAGPEGRLGSLLAAVLAVGALAALTGGLHLDGLADLADGLGSRRPAADALAIMKKSDIGPFGVVALVLILLVQVAALARAESIGRGAIAVVAAAVTSRLAMTAACRRGVPAARGSGLGALVAGSVPGPVVAGLVLVDLAAAAAFGWVFAVGVAAGLAVSAGLTALAVRRLGGITGDVLGAIAETTMAACLLFSLIR